MSRAQQDQPASSEHGQDLARRMTEALEKVAASYGDVGVQAVLRESGHLAWSACRGLAVRESSVPVVDQTMFCFASFGKLVLAAFALRQVEAGRLELDRPIEAYIGDTVPGSGVVTARMLMGHTAGYPDVFSDPKVTPFFPPGGPGAGTGSHYDPNRPYTFDMLAAGIHNPVDPGEHWDYSNAAYLVLGHVLSSIVGDTEALERACMDFVACAGGGMTIYRSQSALPRLAHGYLVQRDGTLLDYFTAYGARGIPTDLYGLPFADGAFAGTAMGAAQFLDELFVHTRLLRSATVREMIAPTPQAAAIGETYGLGTRRVVVGERIWQGHTGTYGGFTALGGTDRSCGATLVVVANRIADVDRVPPGSDHVATVIWTALAETYEAEAVGFVS
ncbi:MAG: beta-lactamase family protein [Kutzneria sp.]|nr:beta-lactamase family protein [Kutzneria sp.]MBV9845687.1 beta-lactamase family protein [Kutzneria sp.]